MKTNQVQALLELVNWKRLRKHVSKILLGIDLSNKDLSFSNNILLGIDLSNKDLSFSNNIPNEVILHINVFRPLMIHLIFSQVYGTLTIIVNNSNTLM